MSTIRDHIQIVYFERGTEFRRFYSRSGEATCLVSSNTRGPRAISRDDAEQEQAELLAQDWKRRDV